jgi:hypothetical protein
MSILDNKEKNKENLNVEIKVEVGKNGLRYGTIKLGEFIEQFPKQVLTTTNMNHLEKMQLSPSVLGTEITEIPLDVELVSSVNIQEKITSGNLYMLNVKIPKGCELDFAKVKKIIDEQIKAGLKIIRVFLTPTLPTKEAKELIDYALGKAGTTEPVLDLLIDYTKLSNIYLYCIEKKLKLVGFISRGFHDLNVLLNMEFIRSRPDDKIVRHVSWINPRTRAARDYIRSFTYYEYGFDLFAFQTRIGDPNVPIEKIKQLSDVERVYVPVVGYGKCGCVAHGGEDCQGVANEYQAKRCSSTPSSVHSLRVINDVFANVYSALAAGREAYGYFRTEEMEAEMEAIKKVIAKENQ